MNEQTISTKYCLYARKSTESDERQAMSIDSQIHEMQELARKEKLHIIETYKESHSAKTSGTRPLFNQMLGNVNQGRFDGILAWSPDRLSRNAGDLGVLVDLMDRNKLVTIKTYSQSFTNNPNEKFLLMILCSQAKLENDNRGLHVKRGIRARCDLGWRPAMPPLGYLNHTIGALKDIIIDPDRAEIVKEMFLRAANGKGGRSIKEWIDSINLLSRTGKRISLSTIYLILNNTFYYGEFEYPEGSGKWYTGKHEPLITKEFFQKVQEKLVTSKKGDWGKKNFAFKGFLRCGSCGTGTVGEEKIRKLKYGGCTQHIYYHCTRARDFHCQEPYISEKELTKELTKLFETMRIDQTKIHKDVMTDIEKFHQLRYDILHKEYINGFLSHFDYSDNEITGDTIRYYAQHVLNAGTFSQKRNLFTLIQGNLYLKNHHIVFQPKT